MPYDRVFALHTLRDLAQERNDARLVRNPALHAYRGQSGLLGRTVRCISRFWTESFVPPDSPVCLGGQSGTPGQSGFLHRTVRCIFGFETERFVQPDCPVMYGGLSGLAVTASSDHSVLLQSTVGGAGGLSASSWRTVRQCHRIPPTSLNG